MVEVYVSLVKKGLRKIEEIPVKYRNEVINRLRTEGYLVEQ